MSILSSLYDYDVKNCVKMPNCTFYGGNDEFFFLFLDLSAFPKKTTPGKFVFICHFQLTGINAIDFEEKRIHFKCDVLAAVAFVDAKAPY